MKILQVCRQYYPSVGGVERFVDQLTGHLVERGHQVEIATLDRIWHVRQHLPHFERIKGIPVHRLPFVGGALFFCAPAVLARTPGFDVVHVHNTDFFLDFLAATRWRHRKPLVVSTHGGFFHTGDQAAIKALYFRWITQRSLKAAAVVVPNSASDEQRFGPYARRAVRIDNAIEYEAFAAIERQPVPGRLLTVGRLAPNKNVAALLRAVAAARLQRPDLTLVIVGDGPERPALEALATELQLAQAVIWRGAVDDAALKAELVQAEFFVTAATYEGFGLALLEAMAAGVIPIANRIEAFEALVTEGENGFLIDYNIVAAASQGLLSALALPDADKARLSQVGRAAAAAYSWKTAVPKFERVYGLALEAAPDKT